MDNIKWILGWSGVDWTILAQDTDQCRALVNSVMNVQVAQNIGKFLCGFKTGDFSRTAQFHETG
jgi:hypothetical protein